jgi:hypothetical protein
MIEILWYILWELRHEIELRLIELEQIQNAR